MLASDYASSLKHYKLYSNESRNAGGVAESEFASNAKKIDHARLTLSKNFNHHWSLPVHSSPIV